MVFSFKKNRYSLHGAEHKTTTFSDHQILMYFKSTIILNLRQVRLAEEPKQYNIELLYRKGSSKAKAAILSRCPGFTSEEGSTNSATN